MIEVISNMKNGKALGIDNIKERRKLHPHNIMAPITYQ